MNLNVRSVFVFSQAVGKLSMIPRRQGRIINIASIAGLAGNAPDMETIAYNTSKGAVVNFTRTLAAEWGEHGINVNAIAPGFFPSKMTQGTLAHSAPRSWPPRAPLRRLGDDDDLKGAALLFACDAGKHITGQILAVDGGVSRRCTAAEPRARPALSAPDALRRDWASSCAATATARPSCASTWPRRTSKLGRGARRRGDDDARRGDGACGAHPQRPRRADAAAAAWPRSR